jgi:hypothetical protein
MSVDIIRFRLAATEELVKQLRIQLEGQKATVRVHELTIRQVSATRDSMRDEVARLRGLVEQWLSRFDGDTNWELNLVEESRKTVRLGHERAGSASPNG